MREHKLFITSAVLLVLGLLWSQWNGTASIDAGDSIAAWAVKFSGSVNGLPALIGILLIVAAIIIFFVALIRILIGSSKA